MKSINQVICVLMSVFVMASCCEVKAAEQRQYVSASNKPNCKISDRYYELGEHLEWSGKCHGGFAQGNGVLKRYDQINKLMNEDVVWLDAKGEWQGHALFYVYINGEKVLAYDGDLRDGTMKNGVGKYFVSDKIVYDGHIENGKANGYGVAYYTNGARYKGQWSGGYRSGSGSFFDSAGNIEYEGSWLNDYWDGHGKHYINNGSQSYEVGSWTQGRMDIGTITYGSQNEPLARWDGSSWVEIGLRTQNASASSDDEEDDQSQQSTGSQVVSGLLQGLTRGIGTYQATRAPVVAARTQAAYASAAAQRAQASAAALALAQQQAQQAQARQNSSYSQPASQVQHSQDATSCVSVSDNLIHNRCGTTISVVWCVQGDYSDCNRGYDNESDILAGSEITALPLRHPGTTIKVNYSACTGSNTATAHGWSVKCD